MTWTLTNLVIHIIAGVLGGHAAAAVAHEHRFGFVGHTITGGVGGTLSGLFAQALAVSMVRPDGGATMPTAVEDFVLQAITGLAAGACVTLVVGLAQHAIDQHRSHTK